MVNLTRITNHPEGGMDTVTWPILNFWSPLRPIYLERLKLKTSHYFINR